MLVAYAPPMFSTKHAVFSRSVVFLDVCSHSRRTVLSIFAFTNHPFITFTAPRASLRCIVFCFSCAVGVVACFGLLVGCTPFIRDPCTSCSFLHDLFLVLPRHDHTAIHRYLLVPSIVACVSTIVSPFFPSPCEGLRILSPRIYIIHPPPRFIVKFTHLSIVRPTLTPPSP